MNLRLSSGYHPNYGFDPDGYFGAMDPRSWDQQATPKWILEGEESYSEPPRGPVVANSFLELYKGFAKMFPMIAPFANAAASFMQNRLNRQNVAWQNKKSEFEARRADWYNSPVQQLKRLKAAGLNPFMQSYVKNYPANVPSYEAFRVDSPQYANESISSILNALTNYQLSQYRADNLDSLTAINDYKAMYLLPQLFDRNNYVNSIMELQVAWETKNYEYERQVKQNILNAQYELALIDTAQGIMENSAQIPGSYVKVDPVAGTLFVQIPDENGNVHEYGLHELPFDKLPPHLQKILTDVWSERTMTISKSQLNTIIGNTQSALGGLYNANRQKVEIYVNEWEKFKIWPDADPVLRAATGSLDWSNLWKMTGYNTANRAINTAMDIGAAFANPKYLLSGGNPTSYPYGQTPMASPIKPEPLNIPRGAKPYTVNGQTYWYYPK